MQHSPTSPTSALSATAPPDTLTLPIGSLRIRSLLGRGKSACSWLATLGGQEVVLKIMKEESSPYQSVEEGKIRLEEQDYLRLREAGIPVPAMLFIDHERGFLVKEFIDGINAHRLIAGGLPSPVVMIQLFDMASRCRARGWNIDYFPTNFVIRSGRLYYVDYEVNPFSEEWSLERWGLYYWANTAGMCAFLQNGSATLLHQAQDSGIPIKTPFEGLVRSWKEEFGRQEES